MLDTNWPEDPSTRTPDKKTSASTPLVQLPTHMFSLGMGAALGAAFGLAFGLSSQLVNLLVLSGVPLSYPPFGFFSNCLAITLAGAVVGLVTAYPESSINGSLAGTAMCLVILEVRALTIGAMPATLMLLSIVNTIPAIFGLGVIFALALPLVLVLRWAIDVQKEQVHRPLMEFSRWQVPLLALGLMIAIGLAQLYSADTRRVLTEMHTLVQTGVKAEVTTTLPTALRPSAIATDFRKYGSAAYTVEESADQKIRADLSAVSQPDSPIILARFENGWELACLFEETAQTPRCISYLPGMRP